MKELTIEEKLELLKELLEAGADIQAKIHHVPSKEEAEVKANYYAEKLGQEMTRKESGETAWYSNDSFNLTITLFYDISIEEKKARLLKEMEELEDKAHA